MIKADLHLHSRYSDGSDSLEEIFQKCIGQGLDVIALTDHDAKPNEEQIKKMADKYHLNTIIGMECGTTYGDSKLDAHILGYNIQDYEPLETLMRPVLQMRHDYSLWQIKYLQELGYDITEEEALGETDGGCIYRQHINYVLYKKGLIDEMFGSWMQTMYRGKGPLRVSYQYPDTAEVIRAITKGGGVSVLAHPGQQQNLRLVPALAEAGLAGVELVHPSNTPFDLENIVQMAKKYHLFLTGGSDSHGVLSPKGGTIGKYVMQYESFEDIFCTHS